MKPSFPIESGRWYQLTLVDGDVAVDSPIRMDAVERGPRGRLRLVFFHAVAGQRKRVSLAP